MNLSCPICFHDIKIEDYLPFSEKVTCENCKIQLIVEYDYSGEDYDLSFWLTKANDKEEANKG